MHIQLVEPIKDANLNGHSCMVNYILIYSMIFFQPFRSPDSGIMRLEQKEQHCCCFNFQEFQTTTTEYDTQYTELGTLVRSSVLNTSFWM